MSLEFLERRPDNFEPFTRGLTPGQIHFLEILKLTPQSNAAEVRSSAVSARHKFEEGGLDIEIVQALRWALHQTNDARGGDEFMRFLLDGVSFADIEEHRFDFR
jgi:hypothetical protein